MAGSSQTGPVRRDLFPWARNRARSFWEDCLLGRRGFEVCLPSWGAPVQDPQPHLEYIRNRATAARGGTGRNLIYEPQQQPPPH